MVNGTLRRALRWFAPGMRIKRWCLLVLVSTSVLAFAVLESIGKERIVPLYRLLPRDGAARHAILAGLAVAGLVGFSLGLARLVRSVARGVAPGRGEKPGDLIYRTRILEKGPQVVALGGGTGLSTLLRGLKEVTSNLTAVVAVMDDGGSSGRLRAGLDVLPPGDVRNCILALAEDEQRMERLLQHRFRGTGELGGHSLGNLLLVGMEQATGGFDRAIEEMSHILNVRGRVLPATLTKTNLVAQFEDGERMTGESRIGADPRRIVKIELSPARAEPYAPVLEAIERADLILLGPGSLFTSLVPNLLVEGIAAAIEAAPAEKVLIANLMTEPGETDGFTLCDHLRSLDGYVPMRCFDTVIVNSALPAAEILESYRREGAEPVRDDLGERNDFGVRVVRADLLGTARLLGKTTAKHDPAKLARVIAHATQAFARGPL